LPRIEEELGKTARVRRFRVEKTVSRLDVWTRGLGRSWLYWPTCIVGVSLMALALLAPEAQRRCAVEHQCARMDTEVAALQQTRDQLAAAAHALQHDPAYAEQVTRHDQNIVRPGEMRLPLPAGRLSLLHETPEPAESTIPPVVAELAVYADQRFRLGAMVAGASLLAAGIVFSLPTRPKRRAARAAR